MSLTAYVTANWPYYTFWTVAILGTWAVLLRRR